MSPCHPGHGRSKTLLIFARRRGDRFQTHMCDGDFPGTVGDFDKALGEGVPDAASEVVRRVRAVPGDISEWHGAMVVLFTLGVGGTAGDAMWMRGWNGALVVVPASVLV